MQISFVKWPPVSLLVCCCCVVALFSSRPSGAGPSESPVGDLHVFIFEELSDSSSQATEAEVTESDDVDFPEKVSESALGSLTGFAGRISGLPEKIRYLDTHTFKVEGKIQQGLKWEKRENRFARLDYRIRVVEWREERFVLELEIRFRREKWHVERIRAENPSRTTIVRLNGKRPLGVALSRLGRTVDGCPVVDFDTGSGSPFQTPEILKQSMPLFPPELERARVGDKLSVLACLDTDGRVRPSGFILLDCSHPRFAEAAMSTIFRSWRFKPARKNGKAIEVAVTIEVDFDLLPPSLF